LPKINVVKTGPNRPVRPGTGHSTDPGGSCKPEVHGTGQKSLKTGANRLEPVPILKNRPVQFLA
jgi:hypothetical protein